MNEVQNEADSFRLTPDRSGTPRDLWKVGFYRDLVSGDSWSNVLGALAQSLGVDGAWLVRGGQPGCSVRLGSWWRSPLADSAFEPALSELEARVEKWLVDDDPLIIDDLEFDPRVAPFTSTGYGIRSLIAVPLVIHGKRVGILYLADAQPHMFDPSHLSDLGEVAATLGHRVANEAVMQHLQQKNTLHQAVCEITRVMVSKLDLKPSLQFIVNLVRQVAGHAACWVALHGEQTGGPSLEIVAAQGIDSTDVARLLSRVGGWAAPEVRHVQVDHPNFRSVTILPVALGGTLLGSLGIATDDHLPVDGRTCRNLETFCRLAALTIQKDLIRKQQDAIVMQTVQALVAALEARDPWISAHSHRVSYYLGRLAEHLGAETSELQRLVMAGLLHDIGKIALPLHLLTNHEPLTPAEREVVRQHPLIGAQILSSIQALQPIVPTSVTSTSATTEPACPRDCEAWPSPRDPEPWRW